VFALSQDVARALGEDAIERKEREDAVSEDKGEEVAHRRAVSEDGRKA
jgi:hypothetical protein